MYHPLKPIKASNAFVLCRLLPANFSGPFFNTHIRIVFSFKNYLGTIINNTSERNLLAHRIEFLHSSTGRKNTLVLLPRLFVTFRDASEARHEHVQPEKHKYHAALAYSCRMQYLVIVHRLSFQQNLKGLSYHHV